YGVAEDLLKEYAWHTKNTNNRVRPVGLLKPNDFGLFDVYGNVNEWCQSRLLPYPLAPRGQASEDTEEVLDIKEDQRFVHRGGGFPQDASLIRSAERGYNQPSIGPLEVGFRVARTCR